MSEQTSIPSLIEELCELRAEMFQEEEALGDHKAIGVCDCIIFLGVGYDSFDSETPGDYTSRVA